MPYDTVAIGKECWTHKVRVGPYIFEGKTAPDESEIKQHREHLLRYIRAYRTRRAKIRARFGTFISTSIGDLTNSLVAMQFILTAPNCQ